MADRREQIHLAVEPEIKSLLQEAAKAAGASSLTAYVLQAAVAQSHEDIANKRVFLLNEKAWNEFNEMLDAPPRISLALQKLMTEAPPWS